MILSTGCIDWAALRSGLSLPDFMASLTPERGRGDSQILQCVEEVQGAAGGKAVRSQAASGS